LINRKKAVRLATGAMPTRNSSGGRALCETDFQLRCGQPLEAQICCQQALAIEPQQGWPLTGRKLYGATKDQLVTA
jgi:hypothetical protein